MNDPTAFLERLTAAAGEYNKARVGTLSALDAVYLDVRPEVARMGQTIRVYFPDLSAFTDQAGNDWDPDDVTPNYVDVPFGERPGKAILIRDFEQFQTSTDIIDQFIDPNFKRAQEYANGAVFAQVTTGNFNTYAPIVTNPAQIDIGSAKLAWNLLVRNKIPLQDYSNASLLYHADVHANTLTDTDWYQENLVGAIIAQGTRQDTADPGTPSNRAFSFTRRYDQQAPTSTTALTGTLTPTNGSTAVTGSSTAFTTQIYPAATTKRNVWITFAGDTQSYAVASVTDDTHLTLAQSYQGTGGSAVAATRVTYTGIAMHKFAIALAVRPLEIVNNGQVQSRLMKIKGLPMRLQLSYQHLKSGWLMTLDYGMVCRVIRPDFGVILQS